MKLGTKSNISKQKYLFLFFNVGRISSLFVSKVINGVLQVQQYNPAGVFITWNWKGELSAKPIQKKSHA